MLFTPPPRSQVLHFDVGILFPNWLENATLLGQVRRQLVPAAE
jgi:hypothetical protein